MGVRGPIGKGTDALAESGRLRPSDHGKRSQHPSVEGIPDPPEGLEEPGKSMWFQIVDHLTTNGLCGEIDTAGIAHCCQVYNLLQKTHRLVQVDPTDKDSRCAYTAYAGEWRKWVEKYGMTPLDRLRIVVGHDKGGADEDGDLLGD